MCIVQRSAVRSIAWLDDGVATPLGEHPNDFFSGHRNELRPCGFLAVWIANKIVHRVVDRQCGIFGQVVNVGNGRGDTPNLTGLEAEQTVKLPVRKEGSIARSAQTLEYGLLLGVRGGAQFQGR